MLFYLMVLVALGTYCFAVYSTSQLYFFERLKVSLGVTVTVSFLFFIFILLPASLYIESNEKYKDIITVTETVSVPTVSLNNSNGLKGSFFLGCGTIEQEEKYIFMKALGNNSYIKDTLPTKTTVIVESSKEAPSLKYDILETQVNPHWDYICPRSFTNDKTRSTGNYRLVVPPGTIIQQYQVN